MIEKRKLTELLERVGSDDEQQRIRALGKLRREIKKGVSDDNARTVVRAAVGPWIHEIEWRSTDEAILDSFNSAPRAAIGSELLSIFPNLSPKGRRSATRLLAGSEEIECTRCWLELVRRYARTDFLPEVSEAAPNVETKAAAEALLPEVLDYIGVAPLTHEVLRIAYRALAKGLVDSDRLRPKLPQIAVYASELRVFLEEHQQDTGVRWMWTEDYISPRSIGGLVVDVLGRMQDRRVQDEISKWLSMRDPYLLTYAVLSQLRLGGAPLDQIVNKCASRPETRLILYKHLVELGCAEVFPSEYCTQKHFSEAEMVRWLSFPTELNTVPDEIELMGVLKRRLPGQIYFLWRFRTLAPGGHAEDGWMAGLSGPYRENDRPSAESPGDTFSSFKKWDEMTPMEHARKIAQAVRVDLDGYELLGPGSVE